MTALFERELESGLEELAAVAELPSAGFNNRVRSGIATHRRRSRMALATAGIASCTAAVLSLTPAIPGNTLRGTTPAAGGTPAAEATAEVGTDGKATPCDVTGMISPQLLGKLGATLPVWSDGLASVGGSLPSGTDDLGVSPTPNEDRTISKIWGSCTQGSYSTVQRLWQGSVGTQLVVLVAGRQEDGRTAKALLVGYPQTRDSPGLSLLVDLPMLTQPSAPIAFGLSSGSGNKTPGTFAVLATPCADQQPTITTDPGDSVAELQTDPSGAWLASLPEPRVVDSVTVWCDSASSSTTSFRLNQVITAPVTANETTITLFTAQSDHGI